MAYHADLPFSLQLVDEAVDLPAVEGRKTPDVGVGHRRLPARRALPEDTQDARLGRLPVHPPVTVCATRSGEPSVDLPAKPPIGASTAAPSVEVSELALHLREDLADLVLRALAQPTRGRGVDLRVAQQVLQHQQVVHGQMAPLLFLLGDERAERRRELRGSKGDAEDLAPILDGRRRLPLNEQCLVDPLNTEVAPVDEP